MDYASLIRLTGFRIRNFKMFRDVSVRNLPPLAIFIGANASGKSTLFDVFRFLRDLFSGRSLNDTFAERGGFAEVLSRGAKESVIEIALNFLLPSKGGESPNVEAEYVIRFGVVKNFPFISAERFVIRENQKKDMIMFCVNYDADNEKMVMEITGEYKGEDGKTKFVSPLETILKGFGHTSFISQSHLLAMIEDWSGPNSPLSPLSLNRDKHSLCSQTREFICDLFVADFDSNPVRKSAKATGIDRLSEQGENFALVAKKIRENNPDKFESAVSALRRCVPEIKTVEPVISEDGYAFLRFIDRNFDRSFNSRAMSDGTVLAFAYLLLFADAKEKLICIDEIERSLYPGILRHLLVEMRKYAQTDSSQVIVSTHSPDLLNYAELDEVFWLAKKDGYTQIHRAKDDEEVSAFVENGDLPGWVWRKGLFAGADPESKVE